MTGTVLLYDPTAPRLERDVPAQQVLAGLAGKVVGFIDNAKPNFNYLVDDIAELLMSKHGVSRVLKRQKRSASVPAPDELIKEFAEQCDLVITGSGD
ncbi:MAG: hypothetical protein NTW47_16435 [Proteobacteria bacterium]|jgi:hypothetical protein|nr:hypothetical protein [Pseudomonadota bacterium]